MDDIFGQKNDDVYEKGENPLKESKPQKKISPAAQTCYNSENYKLKKKVKKQQDRTGRKKNTKI